MVKLSLICATLGRKVSLYEFIDSLVIAYSNVDKTKLVIQLIVVDQNEVGFLDFCNYRELDFEIKHIHSATLGLSHNRNLGLRYSDGDYVCFPDDDCLYYPGTLVEFVNITFRAMGFIILGRIYSDIDGNILKRWPNKDLKLRPCSTYHLSSSITMFLPRDDNIKFDQELGVGAKYGSCEDPDFILQYLVSGYSGLYFKDLKLWHPLPSGLPSQQRVNSYAAGFGRLVSKWSYNCLKAYAIISISHKILKAAFSSGYKFSHFFEFIKGFWRGYKRN